MGIMKTMITSGIRKATSGLGDLMSSSPRLTGLAARGADILTPDGPGKGGMMSTLTGMFQEKGLSMVRDRLFGEGSEGMLKSIFDSAKNDDGYLKKALALALPAIAAGMAFLSKFADKFADMMKTASADISKAATKEAPTGNANAYQPGTQASVGVFPQPAYTAPAPDSNLAGMIKNSATINHQGDVALDQKGPIPGIADAKFNDWLLRNRSSLDSFTHTEKQLREKQNVARMLVTDQRMNPNNPEITLKIDRARSDIAKAEVLHMKEIDQRVALTAEGAEFSDRFDLHTEGVKIPEDWNRPKEHIPEDWDQQPSGPSR